MTVAHTLALNLKHGTDIVGSNFRGFMFLLWNGKWHYEKITEKHSVKQVQNRDKIKVDEIEKYGYIPYIIKDMGKFSENKVNKEFNKFLKWACIASVS